MKLIIMKQISLYQRFRFPVHIDINEIHAFASFDVNKFKVNTR
jgi:hypothetical protein